MSEAQRQFARFPLDIEARICAPTGECVSVLINEISVGGCFFGDVWVETAGEVFRLEVRLPSGNWLPLDCIRVHVRGGVGAKFTEITLFEQSLLAEVIAGAARSTGTARTLNPFAVPDEPADIRIRRRASSSVSASVESVSGERIPVG